MRRQLRRYIAVHLVQGRIGVGLLHIEESFRTPIQHPARPLDRHHGIIEAGRGGAIGDGGDFRTLLLDALREAGA